MRERCAREKHPAWSRYGGRGIKVAAAWGDFGTFLSDVGEAPAAHLTLDRKDNDGNYEPCNVRWATTAQQNANKTKGVTPPVKSIAAMPVVKAMHAAGVSTREIAKTVSMGKSQVWKIVSGAYDDV